MSRKNKKVLVKYNTIERRTNEDNALVNKIKTLLRWLILTTLLFFPFMFYVPFYFENVTRRSVDMVIFGWDMNKNRSVPLYVIPNNDTAIIDGSELCFEPLLLLIVVCSAVNNTLERTTIRETWGNYSSPDFKLAFLLGTTDNATVQEAVINESEIYNDVIQENFVDSYNNLTLKSVMMLKFVKNHCKDVKYIFKSDDDIFASIHNLLLLIKLIERKHVKNVLVGNLICGAKPIQQVTSKWYTPKYMFHEKTYPHYLSGTGYLMDRDTALKLYEAALIIPYLHLEDIFITGLCSRKAQISPRNHSGFYYHSRPLDPCLYKKNQNIFTSHRVTLENMRQLWTALNNGTECPNSRTIIPRLEFLRNNVGIKSRCS